jgi:hypothetical protein
LVSSGSLLSKLLVKVVDPVVTVVFVVKGSVPEGPEGLCCRMERRATRVAVSVLLRRDVLFRLGSHSHLVLSSYIHKNILRLT